MKRKNSWQQEKEKEASQLKLEVENARTGYKKDLSNKQKLIEVAKSSLEKQQTEQKKALSLAEAEHKEQQTEQKKALSLVEAKHKKYQEAKHKKYQEVLKNSANSQRLLLTWAIGGSATVLVLIVALIIVVSRKKSSSVVDHDYVSEYEYDYINNCNVVVTEASLVDDAEDTPLMPEHRGLEAV